VFSAGNIPAGVKRLAKRIQSDKKIAENQDAKTPCFHRGFVRLKWLRGLDLNQRHSGYELNREPSIMGFIGIYMVF
jgi:hypothetical protein